MFVCHCGRSWVFIAVRRYGLLKYSGHFSESCLSVGWKLSLLCNSSNFSSGGGGGGEMSHVWLVGGGATAATCKPEL